MKSVLITGGAGFIGSHLVDHVLKEGQSRVTVIDDFNDFYDPGIKRANIARHIGRENFKLVEADIADDRAMNDLFAQGRFDIVIHLAARAGVRPSVESPLLYAEANVRGTYSLLEAARKYSVSRFIFGSSSSVYGVNAKVPFAEDDPILQPISPYAATKIAGEAACHAYSHLYGITTIALRFFTVYGARQRPDLAIHKFARLISESRPIPVFGDGTTQRDYTYIDDIISGIAVAMNYSESLFEVINLGESQTVKLSYLIEVIEKALDRRAIIDRRPPQAGDVPLTYADISKARRLLGYNPVTKIEEGIEKFVSWFRKKTY